MTATNIHFDQASDEDLETIIALLHDDALGQFRESNSTDLTAYQKAFQCITNDPNAEIIVARLDNTIVGVFQINFIANLTYQGGTRALIEGVRVDKSVRGQGIGRQLIEHGIELARNRNCCLVQLTTDKKRPEALEFYKSLGFIDSHVGLKLRLSP